MHCKHGLDQPLVQAIRFVTFSDRSIFLYSVLTGCERRYIVIRQDSANFGGSRMYVIIGQAQVYRVLVDSSRRGTADD